MTSWRVRATSTQSGRVVWVRPNGMPTETRDEAGSFSLSDASSLLDQVGRSMPSWLVELEKAPPGNNHNLQTEG